MLYTQDEDFLSLHAEGRSHAGIVHSRPNSQTIGRMVQGLMLIYQILEPEEMHDRIEYL